MQAPYAVYVTKLGGPEVLQAKPIDMPVAQANEVVIAHTAIAVNFVDVYLRAGQPHSHNPDPPFIPGVSGVGRIVEVGASVTGLAVGDLITYTNAGVGSYCTHVALPAERAIPVPAGLSDERVAAGIVRALTSQYLLKQMYPFKAGDTVLIHAAAGGVGQILTQWAKRMGLKVIATAGSDKKVAIARELGADFAINYCTQDFVAEVKRITNNEGVCVVFDSVGRTTFDGSVACLAPKGLVINFGTASGQVEGFALQDLHARSLWVCRPTLRTYVAKREDMLAIRQFGWISKRFCL
jgi:NADPH2:quinone reductase